MLRGETMRLEPFKDELSEYGQHFSDRGNLQGATFIYAVYQMADHMMPKQHENLQVRPERMHLQSSNWRCAQGHDFELQHKQVHGSQCNASCIVSIVHEEWKLIKQHTHYAHQQYAVLHPMRCLAPKLLHAYQAMRI